jgi:hypothetical protein
LKILVTKKHIKKGMRGEYDNCPIALAMQGAGLKKAGITTKNIIYWENYKWVRKDTPELAAKKMTRYDGCGEMIPFEFELDIEGNNE